MVLAQTVGGQNKRPQTHFGKAMHADGPPLQAVRVLLVENNTLCFTAGRTAFYRSYIGLERNNWLSTLSTTLTLNDSRVNISDFFSWWVAESLQHIDADPRGAL